MKDVHVARHPSLNLNPILGTHPISQPSTVSMLLGHSPPWCLAPRDGRPEACLRTADSASLCL